MYLLLSHKLNTCLEMWTCIYRLEGSWLMSTPWKLSWISTKDKANLAMQQRAISAPEHTTIPNLTPHLITFYGNIVLLFREGRFDRLRLLEKGCCTYISCHIYPHDKGTCQCLPMKRLCICDTGVLGRAEVQPPSPPRDSCKRCYGTRDVTRHSYWQDIVTCYPGVISF